MAESVTTEAVIVESEVEATQPIKSTERQPTDTSSPELDIEEIGKTFMETYYHLFQNDRAKLETYYREYSCLSFEGQAFQGPKQIMNKLRNLPVKSIQHTSKTIDVQPSGCGGLMLYITGELRLDSTQNPVRFLHSMHIVPMTGSTTDFWINNDIFRLQV